MKTLIIIPAYNEGESIKAVVEDIVRICPECDYLVVNDGSSDNTEAVCIENGFSYVSHPVNIGLAGAIQTGMKYAYYNGYDAAIQIDGDGQHDPKYISDLASEIEKGFDIAIGSRFVSEKKPFTARMIGNNLIGFAIKLTTGKTVRDTTSGMRMFSRKLIKVLAFTNDLGPEPDTVAFLIRKKAKVCETQVEMKERTTGESYLTFTKSINYMARMLVSILILQWFRKEIKI